MGTSCSVDRISSLPDEVREHILNFLPLRDAVKSSILSKEWRNKWTNLPTLIIDESFAEIVVRGTKEDNQKKLMLDIRRVIELHRGPLREFSLTLSKPINQIDQILSGLPYSHIEILTIQTEPHYYDLPKQLFSLFSRLETLRLSFCTFTFCPVSFKGFDRLALLELRDVTFKEIEKPRLSFRCPQLMTLILERCGGSSSSSARPCIVVEECPKLECFSLVGDFSKLQMSPRLPHLKNVTLCHSRLVLIKESGGALPAAEFLSLGNICESVPPVKPWMKLRQLMLDEICLSTERRVWGVARMIMNSPNLQRLAILIEMGKSSRPEQVGETSDSEAVSKDEHNRMLTKVEVGRMKGTEYEMSLISWLLGSSPALDRMEIQFSTALSDSGKLKAVTDLNGLERASNRAKVVVS